MKDREAIHHHPGAALLTAYAAGTLPEAFSLVVAAHLSICDACRAEVMALESVGGAMLEIEEAAALAADAHAKVMAALDVDAPEADPPAAPAGADLPCDVLPAPLRALVGGGIEAVKWKPVGMGVAQAVLVSRPSGTARLLRIPAGAAMPDHGHRGMELTMVLSGAFEDGPQRFGRGDVEVADESLEHTPVADVGEDCICLAATDARLRFRGWLPRLAQPFLGI